MGWYSTKRTKPVSIDIKIARYGIAASFVFHLLFFSLFFFYLKNGMEASLRLDELQLKSFSVGVIDSKQIEGLLIPAPQPEEEVQMFEKPEEESIVKPDPQLPKPEQPIPEKQEPIKQEPVKVEPETVVEADTEEEVETKPELEQIDDVSLMRDEEPGGEELIDVPTMHTPAIDDVFDVETVENLVVSRKRDRQKVKKSFSKLIKVKRLNLKKRLKNVEKTERLGKRQSNTTLIAKETALLVKANQSIFIRNRVIPKWKHYTMSKAMERQYMPGVEEAIKPYWNLALEPELSLQVLIKLKISRQGKILALEFVETSENRFFNQSVEQIFQSLVQLPPLPESFLGESTDIGLRFTSDQIINK